MKKDAIIVGYSGHAFVLIDILLNNKYNILGYCDKVEKLNNPYGLSYLGNEEATLNVLKKHSIFIGIGDNHIRALVFEFLNKAKVNCPSVIHKTSFVSFKTQIGLGTVIMPGAVINAGSNIGQAVICNSSSVIEHECVIGDYAHIAPGAVLAGNVSIGRKTFVGANAVIKQGINVGQNVIIGAGAVVINDVADDLTVYGNPAKHK